MSIFKGSFADGAGVFSEFNVSEDEQKDVEFIYANYAQEMYEGQALVVFARNGKIYEVNGSHCSCYGLEGQWQPEETFVAALALRNSYGVDCAEAAAALEQWQQRSM